MTLTDDEARQAADRLWRQSLQRGLSEDTAEAAIKIVTDLAAELPEPETPAARAAAYQVFLLWMGDPEKSPPAKEST